MDFDSTVQLVRDVIVAGARTNFERDGEVLPAAFILARRSPETGERLAESAFVFMPMIGLIQDKEAAAVVQRKLCEKLDAEAHVFVSEGWAVDIDPEGAAYEDVYAGIGSLKDHPRRIEIVSIQLEHIDGCATWRIPILRDGSKASLGPTEEGVGASVGRMTGFIRGSNRMPEA